MPGAEENAHMGHPDFRVHNRIFATLWPGKKRGVVKLSLPDQSALLRMHPKAFGLNAWSKNGATDVNLAHIEIGLLKSVIETAWRNIAPKKLSAEHGEPQPVDQPLARAPRARR